MLADEDGSTDDVTLGTNVGVASSIGGAASLSSLHHHRVHRLSTKTPTGEGVLSARMPATLGGASASVTKVSKENHRPETGVKKRHGKADGPPSARWGPKQR